MRVLLLTMGGTIDAAAYPEDGTPPPTNITTSGENRACSALRRIVDTVDCIALCEKDSKMLDAQDLQKLAAAIETAKDYTRIIVTMGTDRMPEVARDIKVRSLSLPCPVVFTGAFMPLANGKKSDGIANLSKAALDRPALAADVYIAAGDVFGDPDHITKDFERRVFIEL